ncbi:citrate lyase subunit beta/citryl-CoA lyase [Brevibacterium sanguinis]|uniref:Citrate lyase subunit beta/citryl-CoA lyase n=2 Tax=Brevibacterium TaxID=1696 RepID=A0A366IH82_9MICO|nr:MULTISPECIES: CoA ester lyase [Brevibacterium]RBP63090.1 citrate lyase subunit beta/citryl-CoA lyase [Brevibacterium sanguinis]RBP69734.1 citrate lyase subunit beta/citryl-CoA lyase [Brevibacterium celere]
MTLEFRPAWLFVPGDRPDRFTKAAERSDIVILDLEDAVNDADKAAAREAIVDFPLDPTRTVVRVNARDSAHLGEDLRMLAATDYTAVMVPKAERAGDLTVFGDRQVIALIETALGALGAAEIAAAPNTFALMWGSEDLIADLGGGSSRRSDGTWRDVVRHVRSMTLLAARAHGRHALDSIWADIDDLDGLRAEAEDAVESGFSGKVSIHPYHVPVVREAFRPSPEQLDWATGVLEAARTEKGAFAYRGSMIDAPLLKHAELIVARAQ